MLSATPHCRVCGLARSLAAEGDASRTREAPNTQEETLQSSRSAVDALACVHILDLDDSGAVPAHSVDGMPSVPTVANEP